MFLHYIILTFWEIHLFPFLLELDEKIDTTLMLVCYVW